MLCAHYTTYTLSNYTYTITLYAMLYYYTIYYSLPHPPDPGPRGHILPHSRYGIYGV